MKRIFDRFIILAIAVVVSTTSCRDFLDVSPDMGLSEDEVFGYFDNITSYFERVYNGTTARFDIMEFFPQRVDFNTWKGTLYSATPFSDNARQPAMNNNMRIGYQKESYVVMFYSESNRSPIGRAMLICIRIANRVIENIDRVKDGKENDINDLLGQAYFVRGLAHFCLGRFYGGMPYLDHSLQADDEWDIERLPLYETFKLAADDMYKGYELMKKAGKMRRDDYPGTPGHLTATDFYKPNGTVALALSARALLFAASPLANPAGNKDYWTEAADRCGEALKAAINEKFALLPLEQYATNFTETAATNENLWAYAWNRNDFSANYNYYTYGQNNTSKTGGTCPTQNFVDHYETLQGDILMTDADRAKAKANGHWNDQDPWRNLDPRFEITCAHDGSNTYPGVTINMYKDMKGSYPTTMFNSSTSRVLGCEWGTKDSDQNGYSNTGYLLKKHWWGTCVKTAYYHLDGVRLSELYLNYAEAVNEAYGPAGKAGGMDISAIDAVNVVRKRVGMPDVKSEFTGSTDAFRERIRNERYVELAFEGHHFYYDMRRWKTAPEEWSKVIYGMYVEEVAKSDQYPNGRRYERRPIPDNRQIPGGWKEYMYFYPFPVAEMQKMNNFKNNELWY